MNIQSVKLACFSPTGTSRTTAEAISRGIGLDNVELIDATRPETRQAGLKVSPHDLLVIAVPVYKGRVPDFLAQWFEQINLDGTPVVCVTVYGNREYEDALLELKDMVKQRGGRPVACAAFIGEHSFSGNDTPIAVSRPDSADLQTAEEFGRKVKAKLDSIQEGAAITDVQVPGNYPYKELPESGPVDFIAVSEDCTLCGICAEQCPVTAIDTESPASTDPKKCILCCACIKVCPERARSMKDGPIKDIARRLSRACSARKEPEFYL